MEFNQVLELIKTVSDSQLTGFQYEEGNQKLLLQKVWMPAEQSAGGNLLMGAEGLQVTNMSETAENRTGGFGMSGVGTAAAAEVSDTKVSGTAGNSNDTSVINPQDGNLVKSPLVGRFYIAPAADAEPFVKVGEAVKKGQTLAIVEAMKLMNEIECEYDGVVAEVLVADGEAVEYGQPLFRIA